MKRRRHTPEQIIRKLAEGEKLLSYRGPVRPPRQSSSH
jgi:hypothetical protein